MRSHRLILELAQNSLYLAWPVDSVEYPSEAVGYGSAALLASPDLNDPIVSGGPNEFPDPSSHLGLDPPTADEGDRPDSEAGIAEDPRLACRFARRER